MNEKLLYTGKTKSPEIFTEGEIGRIIKQIFISEDYPKTDWGKFSRYRDVSLIATIYLLGLRPKEGCCLKFADFNFRTSMVKINGKNNKVKKDRVLPVPKVLLQIYKSYFNFPRARFWKGSQYLFPSFQNPHISAGRLKHIFREKCLKPLDLWKMPTTSKIPKTRLYTLRHSRASHILKKQIQKTGQADIYAIANLLGHADLRSTMIYLHTDNEYMEYLRKQFEL